MNVIDAARHHIQIAATYDKVSTTQTWPVVEFVPAKHASAAQKGSGNNTWLIPSNHVDVINAQNEIEAERYQIPLMLAW